MISKCTNVGLKRYTYVHTCTHVNTSTKLYFLPSLLSQLSDRGGSALISSFPCFLGSWESRGFYKYFF